MYHFLLSLVAALALLSCQENAQKNQMAVAVEVRTITLDTIHEFLNLEGEIIASKRHEISFLVSGKLTEINVKQGDSISKGDIIAKIEDSDYQQALAIAKAKLDEANDQYHRLSRMYASGSLAEADYQKVKLLRQQAIANYNLYSNKKSYTVLKSPVSGAVSKIWTQAGVTVNQGQPIVSIINNETMYARIGIPESKVNNVDLTASFKISIPAMTDSLVDAAVYQFSPVASPITRTYSLDLLLDNNLKTLKEGMLCNATVPLLEDLHVTHLPLKEVITESDNMHYVYVARDSIAKKQRVILGKPYANQTIIEAGLHPGDQVIINRPINLIDGSLISY